MQTTKKTENRRLAIFKNDYKLRLDMTIQRGDEFVLGRGYNEFSLDEDGNLVMFVGEFSPHRISPDNFDLMDEVKVTTVATYRKQVNQ